MLPRRDGFALFSTIVNAAVRARMIPANPCSGVRVGQQRHEYDSERRGIEIRTPLKEVAGKVYKGGSKER